MVYLTEWEPLSAALARVVASGASEEQGRIDIANAIADRAVSLRVKVDQNDSDVGGRVLSGVNVTPPKYLAPADIDWLESRPLAPWPTGPDQWDPAERYFGTW